MNSIDLMLGMPMFEKLLTLALAISLSTQDNKYHQGILCVQGVVRCGNWTAIGPRTQRFVTF